MKIKFHTRCPFTFSIPGCKKVKMIKNSNQGLGSCLNTDVKTRASMLAANIIISTLRVGMDSLIICTCKYIAESASNENINEKNVPQ